MNQFTKAELEFQKLKNFLKQKDFEALRSLMIYEGTESFTPSLKRLDEYTEGGKKIYKNWGKLRGLSTGYVALDHMLMGLTRGEVTVIAGKTSRGKTTLALNIAKNISLDDHNVLFLSMEMTQEEIAGRLLYMCGGETEDYAKASFNIQVQEEPHLHYTNISPTVERALKDFQARLLVIDHLHYFTRGGDQASEEIGQITMEVKRVARVHRIPIILISHVRKTDKEATMEDLRGSSYIAQDADNVLLIGQNEGKMMVKIEKNRTKGIKDQYAETSFKMDGIIVNEETSAYAVKPERGDDDL